MKIFLIDKYNELNKYPRELEKYNFENIERKEDCKFKMTKNDFVIISDDNSFDGMEKLKNIIVLVKQKEKKHIWNLASKYKTIDIIDFNMPVEYVCKRIEGVVKAV